jgi:hypothetical protein
LSLPSFRDYLDQVRSTVAADFAAELSRLPGDNRVDLNNFKLFTCDMSSFATPLSVPDPVPELVASIKGSKGLKNILNRFFAHTNQSVAVCLIFEQFQDRDEVLSTASGCVALRAALIGADSTAALRKFLIDCCGRIARDADRGRAELMARNTELW